MLNQVFEKSPFAQIVRDGNGSAVLWHSLFGRPKIVSLETVDFLNQFIPAKSIEEVCEGGIGEENNTALKELLDCGYLVPQGYNEREFLAQKMQERGGRITSGALTDYLELIMSEACNFRCTYCIHFNNLETSDRIDNPQKFMRFEVAKETVDQYLNILRRHGKCVAEINFGGGEPLLAWPVMKQVLEHCRHTYGAEFEFRFSINTNASLITHDIARWLKEYRVEIASSLDGLQDGNDQVRLTKSGCGTFDSIQKGFQNLSNVGYPLEGIAVTVNEHNFPFLNEKIIDWAVEHEMVEVRIDIDVIGMVAVSVEEIVQRLMGIKRYAQSKGIDVAGFWARPAENLNESTLDAHVSFCGAVRGNSMCVSPSGNIYGCGYSTTQLGAITNINDFHKTEGRYHRFVRDRLTGTMEMCKGCMIEGQCGGGCNITQEFARATKSAKIERMCDFYRQMTRELLIEQLHEATSEVEQETTQKKGGETGA